jgi:hypothetical protein
MTHFFLELRAAQLGQGPIVGWECDIGAMFRAETPQQLRVVMPSIIRILVVVPIFVLLLVGAVLPAAWVGPEETEEVA